MPKRPHMPADFRVGLARRHGVGPGESAEVPCYWCDKTGQIVWPAGLSTPSFVDLEIDHLIPIARQGRQVLSNLALACPGCNRERGAQLPPWQPYRLRRAS